MEQTVSVMTDQPAVPFYLAFNQCAHKYKAVNATKVNNELVTATAVTTTLGIIADVRMFRVHDVRENRQAVDVAWTIKWSRGL